MGLPVSQKMMSKSSGTITCNGSGVGAGTVAGVNGEVIGIFVDLGNATSVVATVTSDTAAVMLNGVTVSADTFYPVRRNAVINDGTTAISNSFVPYVNFGGSIVVGCTTGGSGKTFSVVIYYR